MSVPPGLGYGLFLESFSGHCIIKVLPEFYDAFLFNGAGFGYHKFIDGFDNGNFYILVICRGSIHNYHLLSLECPAEQTLYITAKTEEMQSMKISEKFLNPGLISAEDGNTVKASGLTTHGNQRQSLSVIGGDSPYFYNSDALCFFADLREPACVSMSGMTGFMLLTPDQARFFCARNKARKSITLKTSKTRRHHVKTCNRVRAGVTSGRPARPNLNPWREAHDQMQRHSDRHFLSVRRPGGAAVPLCRLRMPGDCPAFQCATAVSGRDSHAESLCPDAERGGCAFPSRLPQSRTCRGGHPQGNPAFGTGCEKGDRGTQAPQKQTSDGNQEFHSARKSQGVVAADHFRSGKGLNHETHHNHCGIRRVRPASGGNDQNVFAVLKNGGKSEW